MKSKEHSYMYTFNRPNGDTYTFIAVDATLELGPRRPYNFFGTLTDVKSESKKRVYQC